MLGMRPWMKSSETRYHLKNSLTATNGSVNPCPVLPFGIPDPLAVHPAIPQSQTRRHGSDEETAGRAHKVARWIAVFCLIRLPDPLRDDLSNTGARIVQRDRKRDGKETRRVAGDPVGHRWSTRESTARSKTQAAIALHVGVVR